MEEDAGVLKERRKREGKEGRANTPMAICRDGHPQSARPWSFVGTVAEGRMNDDTCH